MNDVLKRRESSMTHSHRRKGKKKRSDSKDPYFRFYESDELFWELL